MSNKWMNEGMYFDASFIIKSKTKRFISMRMTHLVLQYYCIFPRLAYFGPHMDP